MLAEAFAAQAPDGSSIVNLLDQRVLKPDPRFFSYALSRNGLWWATRTLAQALAPRIRVNGVGPGTDPGLDPPERRPSSPPNRPPCPWATVRQPEAIAARRALAG